jgi:hypothetical protein
MQDRRSNTLLEQFESIAIIHRGVRLTIYAALLGVSGLLICATGSVLPRCCHILLQVLPLVPCLIMQRSIVNSLLLALLTVQVLTWPALWIVLVWLSVAIVRHLQKRRHTPFRTAWQRERYEVEMAMQGIHAQVTDEIPAMPTSAWQPQDSLSWPFTAETLGQERSGSDAALILHFQERESPFWTYASDSFRSASLPRRGMRRLEEHHQT